MKSLALLFALLALFAFTAAAADFAGTWKGSIETPNGAMENTFVFKVDAGKLTGTVAMGQFGEAALSDGKVDGDAISFNVVREFNGNSIKIVYKGTFKEGQINLSGTIDAMDRTFEMVLKKAS